MTLKTLKSTTLVSLFTSFCALQPGQVVAATTAVTITPATGASINFGSFAVLGTCVNCTITISPTGARSASAGIVLSNSGVGSAATFTVTQTTCTGPAPKCNGYTILGTSPSPLVAGGVSMTLGAFTFNPTVGPTGAPGVVNTLSVGATLTIPSKPTAGAFPVGNFTVTTTP